MASQLQAAYVETWIRVYTLTRLHTNFREHDTNVRDLLLARDRTRASDLKGAQMIVDMCADPTVVLTSALQVMLASSVKLLAELPCEESKLCLTDPNKVISLERQLVEATAEMELAKHQFEESKA